MIFRALLVLAFIISPITSSYAVSLSQSEVGVRFEPRRCGENGVRVTKAVAQVIVVGNSGHLNCIIRITDKLLNMSDIKAGFVCVASWEAKSAEYVKSDDRRVLAEVHYAESLRRAQEAAKFQKIPLEIIYITTNQGPPHREARCRFT